MRLVDARRLCNALSADRRFAATYGPARSSLWRSATSDSTMLNWNDRQRTVLIDKLGDVANVEAGGLLFGQAIAGQVFSVGLALAGVVTRLGAMALSMLLARKRDH